MSQQKRLELRPGERWVNDVLQPRYKARGMGFRRVILCGYDPAKDRYKIRYYGAHGEMVYDTRGRGEVIL
jgi:hypothetical protein